MNKIVCWIVILLIITMVSWYIGYSVGTGSFSIIDFVNYLRSLI